MATASKIQVRPLMLVAVLGGLLVGGLGCQERVVGTRNDWVGTQYRPEAQFEQAEEDEGGLGEFFFGWMDGDDDDENVSRMRVIDVDAHDPTSRQRTHSGSGGY